MFHFSQPSLLCCSQQLLEHRARGCWDSRHGSERISATTVFRDRQTLANRRDHRRDDIHNRNFLSSSRAALQSSYQLAKCLCHRLGCTVTRFDTSTYEQLYSRQPIVIVMAMPAGPGS